jgi:hypothetical protein
MKWLPALLVVCASPAFAQNAQPAFAQNAQPEDPIDTPEEAVTQVGGATLDSAFSLLNAIEVNAGEEGSNAAIRVGTEISDGSSFHRLSLTAGAPLDKDTGSAFSALDPFANGVFLEGRYTLTRFTGRRNSHREAYGICEDVARASGVPIGTTGCDEQYILANAPSRIGQFRNLSFIPNRNVVFGGVTGRIGRDQFKFLEATTGAAAEQNRTPWSIGGFVGISFLELRNSFALEYRHQRSFKAGTTAAVCPAPGTGVTVCPVGPVGPPTEREQNVFTGEYRQRIGDSFAFSIRGSYDTAGNISQLDVPFYFIGDGSLGLNAGVRARYVHDPDEDDLNEGWVFGIFVSKSFSLFR